MKLSSLSRAALLLLLPAVSRAADHTLYIGRECPRPDVIEAAIRSAFARARLAIVYLNLNAHLPSDDLKPALQHLFDVGDAAQVSDLRDRLQKIQDMENKFDITVGWDIIVPKLDDVVIHCDASRIVMDDDNWDPTIRKHLKQDSNVLGPACTMTAQDFKAAHDEGLLDRAMALQAGLKPGRPEGSTNPDDYDRGNSPEVIQLCRSEMDKINDDAQLNDLMTPAFLEEVYRGTQNKADHDDPEDPTSMDMLATLDHVLLHEFSHLLRNGRTSDGPYEDCYGWEITGSQGCRGPALAEVVAFTSLVVFIRYTLSANRLILIPQPEGHLVLDQVNTIAGIQIQVVVAGDLPQKH